MFGKNENSLRLRGLQLKDGRHATDSSNINVDVVKFVQATESLPFDGRA